MAGVPMALSPFRCQIRLSLSDLDRQIFAQRTVAIAQFPDEPDEHILLRFLAQVLCFEETLQDKSGWFDVHEPDLLALDLTGTPTHWIECGAPPLKRLVRAMGHLKSARFVVLFADPSDCDAFCRALVAERPRNLDRIELCEIPKEFMAWLESIGHRNMDWSATRADGTLYLDCAGQHGDCVPIWRRIDVNGRPAVA